MMSQAGQPGIRKVEIEYETIDGLSREYEFKANQSGLQTGEIETKRPDGGKEKRKDDAHSKK
jgi:hypothetical protein